MSALRLIIVLAFTLPLVAQRLPLNEHQLGAYKGSDDAVRSVMNYCDAVDDSAWEQRPRVFAELGTDSATERKERRWTEFASRQEWDAAGKPAPVVFVWYREGAIVRVSVVTPVHVSVHNSRIDYCYGADTRLIRIRAVPLAPQECEFLFPCRLISGREFLLGGQRPAVTDWVFTTEGTISKLRNGKEVDDYFDPSNSLTVNDLHLRTSDSLPFDHIAKSE